jgi:Mg-chelatase subunit ChlD
MRTHLTLLLAVLSLSASAQLCHISGTVTDDKKEVLMSAIVFINGQKFQTDLNGKYTATLPRGIYNFACAYIGYNFKKLNNVNCNKDSVIVDFQMEEAVSEMRELEVVSYKKPLVDKADSKLETVVTKDDIRSSGASGAGDVPTSEAPVKNAGVLTIDGSRADETHYTASGHKLIKGSVSYFGVKSSGAKGKTGEKKGKPSTTTASSPEGSRAGVLTSGQVNDFSKWDLWTDLRKGEFEQYMKLWGIYPRHRYMIEVSSEAGFPVCGAVATMYDRLGNEVWKGLTDNTGKAEMWPDMFEYDTTRIPEYKIKVSYQDQEKTIEQAAQFPNGNNRVVLQADCGVGDDVDIVFTVDATGSMGDEINYLKTELLDVIRKAQKNNHKMTINLGSVFYRDHGDEYLTKLSPLDKDIDKTYNFIKEQSAGGGGDFPEAVDEALSVTLNDIKWHENARAKIVFLILDAPPHDDKDVKARLDKLIKQAAEKGISIVPLACSGVDKSTEYIMRALALATNGTYTFLTDHSDVGGSHIAPSTDRYKVEYMNDLILRLILQYSYYPDCSDYVAEKKKEQKELLEKTDKDFTLVDSTQKVNPDVLNDPLGEDEFAENVKIFPNPTHGELTLEVKGKVTELFLTDITGKVLQRFQTSQGDKLNINIKDNAAGLYFIRYMKDEHWKAGKVVLLKS